MSPDGEGGAGCIHAVLPLDAGIVGSFVTARFCCKKKGPRGKGGNLTKIWYSEIFRWKAQVSKIQRACSRPAHACVSYQYMSIYIIFLKRLSMLLPLVHFGSCLTKQIFRRAVAEKYFAAALPDVRRLGFRWVSLGCSSQRPKWHGFSHARLQRRVPGRRPLMLWNTWIPRCL